MTTEPDPTGANGTRDTQALLPLWLVLGSEWAGRILLIGLALGLAVWGISYVSLVAVPIIVSLFVCALLEPVRRRLLGWRVPTALASALAFLIGVLLIAGVVTLAVSQIVSNFDELTSQSQRGLVRLGRSLEGPPFHLKTEKLQRSTERALNRFKDDPSSALSGAFSVLSTTGGLLAGGLLTLITTLFFMTDRRRIYSGLLSVAPSGATEQVDRSTRAAWDVLVSYVRVTLTEAMFTSVLIGGAAAIAGLPIAFALAILVFLLAFIPTLGAILSGALVVLVALVTQGTTTAVVLTIVVLLVQQLDANVLYPVLTSRRLSIHPLVSLLLVAAGGVAFGLFGAFIAVPLAAMLGAAYAASITPTEPPAV